MTISAVYVAAQAGYFSVLKPSGADRTIERCPTGSPCSLTRMRWIVPLFG